MSAYLENDFGGALSNKMTNYPPCLPHVDENSQEALALYRGEIPTKSVNTKQAKMPVSVPSTLRKYHLSSEGGSATQGSFRGGP